MADISIKIQSEEKTEFLHISDVLYRSIVKRFESLFGKGFASKALSFSAYTSAKEVLGGKKPSDNLQELLQGAIETMVRGKVIKCKIDREAGGSVQVRGSLEARAYGPSDSPVCYLSHGTIRAFAEQIAGKSTEVREEKCTSMGDDYCEFIVIVK